MVSEIEESEGARALKRCSLFASLDEASRRQLVHRTRRQQYAAGDRIFSFGSPGQSMMTILVGTVRISRPTAKGREMILGELGAGDVLGEIAVLDGRNRSADAAAVTKCELLVLDRRELMPFLEQHPAICLTLLDLLCGKLRRADDRMSDVGFADLGVRLAKALLSYSGALARPDKEARISLSQKKIADMVGASRENVNRQLKAWQKLGLVDLQEGWIVLTNAVGLSALVEGG